MKKSLKKGLLLLSIVPLVGCSTAGEKQQKACSSAEEASTIFANIMAATSAEDYSVVTPSKYTFKLVNYSYIDTGDGATESETTTTYMWDGKTNSFFVEFAYTKGEVPAEDEGAQPNKYLFKQLSDTEIVYANCLTEQYYVASPADLFGDATVTIKDFADSYYSYFTNPYEELDTDYFQFDTTGGLSEEDKTSGSTFEYYYGSDNEKSFQGYEKWERHSTEEYPSEEEDGEPYVIQNDSSEYYKANIKDYILVSAEIVQDIHYGDMIIKYNINLNSTEKLEGSFPDYSSYTELK